MRLKQYGLLVLLLSTVVAKAAPARVETEKNRIIDSLISSMTVREKLAQLFIVAFSSNITDKSTIEAIELVEKEKVGGVIIMNSPLTPGVKMINRLQSISVIPLLVTIDGEWGVSMRFDSIVQFPRQMQLGALSSDSLVYEMGVAIGEQVKRSGMHVNYAPTIDINNNPANPVINTRSFGESRDIVARYGAAYMKGMRDAGIPGSAKHFPGHGDTDTDSHHALPLLPFSKARIDSLELYPFKKLIEAGVDMIMIGHLQIPSLDSSGRPSSISKPIVTDLLRHELEYSGIIITDALNMKGVSEYMAPEYLPLEAYLAGSDIILMPEKVKEALDIMERAVQKGEISMHSLNMRCRKMLSLKAGIGILTEVQPVETTGLAEDLNSSSYISLITEIAEKSLIVVKNDNDNIPFKNIGSESIGYLSLGGDRNGSEFAKQLMLYAPADTIVLRGKYSFDTLLSSLNRIADKSHIIIAMHNTDARPHRDFGIDLKEIEIITSFARGKRVTFVYFGNPLALPYITNHENFTTVISAFQNTLYNNIAASHIIFGAVGAQGSMPVTAGSYNKGFSLKTEGRNKLRYGIPYNMSYDITSLKKQIDKLISDDIDDTLYNGAQLLLIKGNNVLINESYGKMSIFDHSDLNSISGLITTLPAIVTLQAKGLLSLEGFLREYLTIDKKSPYYNALISDLLMHRFSADEKVVLEPEYSEENIKWLNAVIEEVTSEPLPFFLDREFYGNSGMSSTSINERSIFSSANDVAKLIYSILNEGEGNIPHMMDTFMHYYSGSCNGGVVWRSREDNIMLIYLNNGTERVRTGDMLRSLIISFFDLQY